MASLCVLLVTGCGPDGGAEPSDLVGLVDHQTTDYVIGEAPLASAIVGADGGRLEAPGIALDIPAGALPGATRISIRTSDLELDEGYALLSEVFLLEPTGLELSEPVTVTLEVPDDASGIVIWSTRDGDAFEFAGFVENGVAQGVSTHFSEVAATEQRGACDTDDECDDGCRDDPVPGDPAPTRSAACGDPVDEPCDRVCYCGADDVPTENLCAQNPGHPLDAYCPDVNDQIGDIVINRSVTRPAGGREMRASRNDEPCVGWGVRSIDAVICECVATLPTLGVMPLCPRPWTNLAADIGGQNWACVTDIELREPNVLREGRQIFFELGVTSWSLERWGTTCRGYWLDQREPPPDESRGPVMGSIRNCTSMPVPVGSEYRDLPGTTHSCQAFAWPSAEAAETFASGDAERLACGELSAEDWARLRSARQGMDMPPRSHRPGNGTAAVLRAEDRDFEGFNGGAYSTADIASETNDFCGPGDYTPSHAEGDALNQLAAERSIEALVSRLANGGKCPPQERGYYRGREIGNCPEGHQGSGEMIVDRDPCFGNCAAYGIDRMRRAACLEEVTVQSPRGRVRFADDLPEHGQLIVPRM